MAAAREQIVSAAFSLAHTHVKVLPLARRKESVFVL